MVFLILGLILIGVGILGVILACIYSGKVTAIVCCTLFYFGVGVIIGGIAGAVIGTAIDAYRGKTTLEITYKDGVPVDTVVVFKEKK